MQVLPIKNRRLKVSPGGVVTLPVSARKTLGMSVGKGTRVTIAIEGDAVAIKPAGGDGGNRVSAKGQLEIRGEPLSLLESGTQRHYWLELFDEKTAVILHPYK